jgi:hypothetical protein
VSYELIVWPVDRAVTVEEAVEQIGHFSSGWQFGLGHDERLDAFAEAVRDRYPALREHEQDRPFEFDVMRKHVFVALPDTAAAEVAKVVVGAAWTAGLAVYDPDRRLLALPAPYGDAPLSVDHLEADLAAATGDDTGSA